MTAATAPAPHAWINALAAEPARAALVSCCGSARWVAGMLARRPFSSTAALHAAAEEIWLGLGHADFLEAFAHHPAIGERSAPRAAEASGVARGWSGEEQARAAEAPADTAAALRALNQAYAARFGHVFIICATGKSGDEILAQLRARLSNDADTELRLAATEQARITHLRLEKLPR